MELGNTLCASRFSKVLTSSLVCLILTTLAFAGGDPWKSKPYQQWDANDIKKIFNDSPWCKVVQVDVSWKASNLAAAQAPAGGDLKTTGQGNGAPATQPGTPPSQSGTATSQPGPGEAPLTPAEANFFVRWISSRTVREAGYRNSVIEGRLKEEEAEKQLAQPTDSYQLYLGGPDMTPFQSVDEKTLQADATLAGKKTKQTIHATKAEFVRSPDGKVIQGVVFSFPKQTDNGEPSISPNEKAVEFTCAVGKVKIQTTFDLSKTEDTKGRDI
jgi:hypothetical protein